MRDEEMPSFLPGRRWRIGLNVLLSIIALGAIVVMVNYLSAQRYKRIDAPGGEKELSPVTRRILQTLTNDVKVVVLFNHRNPLYDPVISLLHRYHLQAPRIQVEQVDYVRYPGRAKQILAELNQDSSIEADRIIFAAGGRNKVVYERELSLYDRAAETMLAGQEVKRTGFRGEQLFTAAIFSVADPRPMKAYFLTGHDEHDATDEKGQSGYAEFAQVLRENNLALAMLSVMQADVPEDCQLLIIPGAKHPLLSSELDRIDNYLNRGGRVLLLFNYEALDNKTGADLTGLHRLTAGWGVDAGENFVLDSAHGRAGSQAEVIISDFGSHPVVNPLSRARLAMILPRSVRAHGSGTAGADAPRVTELLLTSSEASAVRKGANPRAESTGRPLSLGVAVEKGTIQGISSDHGTTRMVILGDSYFLGNVVINHEANRDFARNAVNWLLSREILLEGIGPRPLEEYRINVTEREMRTIQWLMLAAMPGAVLFIGWVVWLRRRS